MTEPELLLELARRRANDPAYLLVTDERALEIIREDQKRTTLAVNLEEEEIQRKAKAKASLTGSDKDQLQEWAGIYRKIFDIKIDPDTIVLPAHKEDFDWLIVVAQGLTSKTIFNKLKELMPCYSYWNNLNVIQSERKADKTYAVRVRPNVEADPDLKNLSYNDVQEKKLNTLTLEERLLLELKHFLQNKDKKNDNQKHLDIRNWTLCAASRDERSGEVPCVYWDDGKLCVYWCDPVDRFGSLRPREAVSNP